MPDKSYSEIFSNSESALGYLNKKVFDIGFVPRSDATAQTRCFTYLEQALALLESDLQAEREAQTAPDAAGSAGSSSTTAGSSHNPSLHSHDEETGEVLQGQKVTLLSVYNLLKDIYGTYRMRSSKTFWLYWDKVKFMAAKILEGKDASEFQLWEKIRELEAGRFISLDDDQQDSEQANK